MTSRSTRHRASEDHHGSNECDLSVAEVFSDDDLLKEILIHLPVKSVLVFKSVSKRWLSLISNASFTHNHCLRNYPLVLGIFLYKISYRLYRAYPEYKFISLDKNEGNAPLNSLTFVYDPSKIVMEQSCNGLLLCKSFWANTNPCSYYIYNPSTRRHTTLPPSHLLLGNTTKTTTISCVSLAFDPQNSPHYKVVCIFRVDTSLNKYQTEIYDSGTRSWRLCEVPVTASVDLLSKPGVFWNGSLHWIIPGISSLCFEVNRELLSTMPTPSIPEGQEARKLEYFGATRDHIHLVERYDNMNEVYVLEMERDYSKWNIKYCLNLDLVITAFPEVQGYMDVNGWYDCPFSVLLVQEEADEPPLIINVPSKVISFDCKDYTFKILKDFSHSISYGPPMVVHRPLAPFRFTDIFQYSETLACT